MDWIGNLFSLIYPAYILVTLGITIYGLLLLRRGVRALERGADALESRFSGPTLP